MKKLNLSDSYQVVNLVFAGIVIGMFVYSGIFHSGGNYPVPSQYKLITGERTQSTGLSRGFSEMVRLNIRKAKDYNENSGKVFAFFLLQMLMRFIFFFTFTPGNKKLMIRIDVAASLMLFLYCFKDFILTMYS
ncbi:MAG: hypothetical protein ACOCTU_05950 [Bacteroidota bacterium]